MSYKGNLSEALMSDTDSEIGQFKFKKSNDKSGNDSEENFRSE